MFALCTNEEPCMFGALASRVRTPVDGRLLVRSLNRKRHGVHILGSWVCVTKPVIVTRLTGYFCISTQHQGFAQYKSCRQHCILSKDWHGMINWIFEKCYDILQRRSGVAE